MSKKLIMLLMTVGVLLAPATGVFASQNSKDVTYVETTADRLQDEEWVKNNDPLYAKYAKASSESNNYKTNILSSKRADSLTHDPKFDGCDMENGIDVSKWQKDIDWDAVKADGIDFAIIRLGFRAQADGTLTEDEYFYQNLEGAYDAGLKVGVYFYTQAITEEEAEAEAEFCVERLKGYEEYISFPVMYDIENTAKDRMGKAKVTTEERTEFCKAFCDYAIESGYKSGVYASLYYFKDCLNAETFSPDYHIWLARYATEYNANGVSYGGEYEMWQYSSTGKVDGIEGNVDMDVYYKGTPDKVTDITIMDNTENSIELKWKKQENVAGYQVELYDCAENLIYTCETTDAHLLLEGLTEGVSALIRVRAYYNNIELVYGNYSDLTEITTKPGKVSAVYMKSAWKTKIKLAWEPVVGATGYKIYKYDSSKKKYVLIGTTSACSYKSTGLKKKSKYKYKIEAYKSIGETEYVGKRTGIIQVATGTDKVESVKVKKQTDKAIYLTWTKQKKVSGYEIACYDKAGELVSICYTNGNKNSYKVNSLESGSIYSFKVRSYISSNIGGKSFGSYSTDIKSITRPAQITDLSVKKTSKNSITLKWSAVNGATGYKLFAYNTKTKKMSLIATTSETSYKISRLSTATKYTYKILAYRKYKKIQYYGDTSDVIKVATSPAAVTNLKQTKKTSKSIGLSWNKVTGASGYRVYRYDSEGNLQETFDVEENSFVDKGLEPGEYTYQVCAFVHTKYYDSLGASEEIDAETK